MGTTRYFNSARFGESLRQALKTAKLHQYDVSHLTGINRSTLSQIISGKKSNVDYIARLLPYLPGKRFEDFVDEVRRP